MVKSGVVFHQNANANQGMIGMDNIAQNHLNAQMVEYGICNINSVYALMEHIGVVLIVN